MKYQIRKRSLVAGGHASHAPGGFTIVETLIVLAIAGLILVIVLLAVPALNRTKRNTERKNDVTTLAAAIQEYSGQNEGALPNEVSEQSTNPSVGVLGCTAPDPSGDIPDTGCSTGGIPVTVDLGYYQFQDAVGSTGFSGVTMGDPTQVDTSQPASYYFSAQACHVVGVGDGDIPYGNTCDVQETIIIFDGYTCDSAGDNLDEQDQNSVALLYAIESGGTDVGYKCQTA